jgi:hypothetical protein
LPEEASFAGETLRSPAILAAVLAIIAVILAAVLTVITVILAIVRAMSGAGTGRQSQAHGKREYSHEGET